MKIFLYLISKLIYRNAITAAGIPSFKGAYEPVSPIPKLLQKTVNPFQNTYKRA